MYSERSPARNEPNRGLLICTSHSERDQSVHSGQAGASRRPKKADSIAALWCLRRRKKPYPNSPSTLGRLVTFPAGAPTPVCTDVFRPRIVEPVALIRQEDVAISWKSHDPEAPIVREPVRMCAVEVFSVLYFETPCAVSNDRLPAGKVCVRRGVAPRIGNARRHCYGHSQVLLAELSAQCSSRRHVSVRSEGVGHYLQDLGYFTAIVVCRTPGLVSCNVRVGQRSFRIGRLVDNGAATI
jgi:hypothetical protein